MCEEHSMVGKGSRTQTAMVEMWELLTVDRKRKVAVRKMDMLIKFMEIKISDLEDELVKEKNCYSWCLKN